MVTRNEEALKQGVPIVAKTAPKAETQMHGTSTRKHGIDNIFFHLSQVDCKRVPQTQTQLLFAVIGISSLKKTSISTCQESI